MYATCLENLDLQPGQSFLDIGSGCGHFTALAGYIVGKVKGKFQEISRKKQIVTSIDRKFQGDNFRFFHIRRKF